MPLHEVENLPWEDIYLMVQAVKEIEGDGKGKG